MRLGVLCADLNTTWTVPQPMPNLYNIQDWCGKLYSSWDAMRRLTVEK